MTSVALSQDLLKAFLTLKMSDDNLDEGERKMHRMKHVITFEACTKDELEMADTAGIKILTYEEVINAGKSSIEELVFVEPQPEDHLLFSYTSGTTGDPKGVMVRHSMLLQTAVASEKRISQAYPVDESQCYISYLPLAHSFEQSLFGLSLVTGCKIGFFGGDVLKLVSDDLPALKPSIFPSVPRLYNRIFGKINDRVNTAASCRKWLAKKAIETKMANLRTTGSVTHGCYDKVVFSKMKGLLGGNVKIMVCGSAPISKDVLDFLKVCFCAPICEGYGMTETSAANCITKVGDPQSGHVGGPMANIKIRLRDIPEMDYLSTTSPPRGEICFWGPGVMKGYYKNEEKTNECLADGWLYSGDVAVVHDNGSIQIIDRSKNIFKLSQGEYIAPEKLENIYI